MSFVFDIFKSIINFVVVIVFCCAYEFYVLLIYSNKESILNLINVFEILTGDGLKNDK